MKSNDNNGMSFFSALAFILGIFSAVFFIFKFLNRPKQDFVERNSFEKKPPRKNVPKTGRLGLLMEVFRKEGEVTVEMLLGKVEDVSERTLRRDLKKLEDLGHIKKVGNTKGSKYLFLK